MVKEWTRETALEPYKLKDHSLSEFVMAASYGAVEVLAGQCKIRNVAHPNLFKHRSFPALNALSANVERSPRTQGLASGACNSVEEHPTGTTKGLSDAKSDTP